MEMKLFGTTDNEKSPTTKDAHAKSSETSIQVVKWMMWIWKEASKEDHEGQDKCNNRNEQPQRGFHIAHLIL